MQGFKRVLANPILFVVMYVVFMIATYILPYGGSNSLVIQSTASATGAPQAAHFKLLFWLHAGSILILCTLTWLRGSYFGKGWLTIFPILAGVFDLIPGLSLIPLIPTVMHLCALIMGSRGGTPKIEEDDSPHTNTPSDEASTPPNNNAAAQGLLTQPNTKEAQQSSTPDDNTASQSSSANPNEKESQYIAKPSPLQIDKHPITEEPKRSGNINALVSAPKSTTPLTIAVFTLAGVIAVAAGIYLFRGNIKGEALSSNSNPSSETKASVPSLELPKSRQATIPDIRVGDSYRYSTEYVGENKPPVVLERTVVAIDSDQVSVDVSSRSSTGVTRRTYYDRQWNLRRSESSIGSQDFSPALRYFDFPLYTGKTWTSESIETLQPSSRTKVHKLSATVKDVASFDMPYGKHDAILVEVRIKTIDGDKQIDTLDKSWYSPKIGRTVLSEISTQDSSTGKTERRRIQLDAYSRSKP